MLTISEISHRLVPIFDKNNVKKAILFGSYASNEATENSDVDLLVDTEDHIKGLKLFGILAEIKEALNLDVDLIVQRMLIKNSDIDIEIKSKGVVIYEKTS